jgi:hypothetical protein
VHPKGKGYSIGGEDGYVRVHQYVRHSLLANVTELSLTRLSLPALASTRTSSPPSPTALSSPRTRLLLALCLD